MKIAVIVVGIFASFAIGLWLLAPANECQGEACSVSEQAEPLAKQASVKAGEGQAFLYDVRTPEEFNAGNAQNSVNFDNQLIQAGQLPNAPKDAEVYVYCRSGNRSAQATAVLEQAGYTNVTDLGGLDNMRAAGVL